MQGRYIRFLVAKKFSAIGICLTAFVAFITASGAPSRHQATQTATPEIVLTLDPVQSTVHWNVDSTLHMVHGTFAVKSGTVHFDPQTGKAGGEVVVLATSGESGNGSRDARMHKEILETPKYPDAVFHPTQLEGKVAPTGTSDVKLHGVLSIHGSDHELVALVHADLAGDHWKGTSKFDVPYIQWGIKDPSNFILKVKPVVNVEFEMSGDVKGNK
jgi:polyisoprenoid-binding protein YceI